MYSLSYKLSMSTWTFNWLPTYLTWTIVDIWLTTYLPHLVHIVCEQPLSKIIRYIYYAIFKIQNPTYKIQHSKFDTLANRPMSYQSHESVIILTQGTWTLGYGSSVLHSFFHLSCCAIVKSRRYLSDLCFHMDKAISM